MLSVAGVGDIVAYGLELDRLEGNIAGAGSLDLGNSMARAVELNIAGSGDVLGAELALLLTPDGAATPLVVAAHDAGLAVHGWTLRRENYFLPPPLRRGDDPAAAGDLAALWAMLAAAGVDAVFTDNPADAVQARMVRNGS